MTTKNDVTGDSMASKKTTDAYRDKIFGKPKKKPKEVWLDNAMEHKEPETPEGKLSGKVPNDCLMCGEDHPVGLPCPHMTIWCGGSDE